LIHSYIIDKGYGQDTFLGNLLVKMYSDCDCIQDAQAVFSSIRHKNVFSWNIMTAAFAQTRDMQKARKCFDQTPRKDAAGVPPDKITLVNILDGCAKFGALAIAKTIESGIADTEFMKDDAVVTNLINVHGKCSSVKHAIELFEGEAFLLDSVILWSSTMAALAQNDRAREAIELFHCLQLYGMEPTRITFSIVLFVCSHGGMMKRGWESFLAMQADHFLNPDVDHFVSMIDLLGRCGWLDLAFELIETMPFVPDDVAWTILLNTSKLYDESTRARLAAKHLMELGDEDSAPYVLLAGV
ncbi:hypothetical protein SELMODRAFT_34491, partial [Selaginella moellendorffii]